MCLVICWRTGCMLPCMDVVKMAQPKLHALQTLHMHAMSA